MKHVYRSLLIAFGLLAGFQSQAQVVNDVVSIGAGYPNQAFYSMDNGELSNISNTDWDLAFQIVGFQATIRINGKNNVRLFKSGHDVNAWSSLTANDTVGVLNSANELFDQDSSWWCGAFNGTNDPADPFDLGWGNYDFATHVVSGDSLYYIMLSGGAVKKLWIQALSANVYYFAYADADGSNEVTTSLNKSNFAGKNFGYYSIVNNTELDREPIKYDWDLTFCQYMSTFPILYKVAGVLSNDSVFVARAYPVDVNTVPYYGQDYSIYANTIGYDWKTYDFNLNSYVMEDSLVYFVQARDGQIWKMIFTGFGGSANGNYEFSKEPVSATGLAETTASTVLSLYPNPTSDFINLMYQVPAGSRNNVVELFSVSGARVGHMALSSTAGLGQTTLAVGALSPGLYTVRTTLGGLTESRRVLITH